MGTPIGRKLCQQQQFPAHRIFQELQTFYQTRQADLKQLGSALQSGDLNGAQQTYNALAALGQGGPFANSEPSSTTSRGKDFEAIGQALQSGDWQERRQLFAALTGKQENAATSSQATPATVVNLNSAQPSAAAPVGPSFFIYEQLQAYRQQRTADLAQLGQDLQTGNLSAAQQDFTTLAALGQTGPRRMGRHSGDLTATRIPRPSVKRSNRVISREPSRPLLL